jgi:hypothetical protein
LVPSVEKEEFLLRPGETKLLMLQRTVDVKTVATMAGVRDRWREGHLLDVGKPLESTQRHYRSRITLKKSALPPADKK